MIFRKKQYYFIFKKNIWDQIKIKRYQRNTGAIAPVCMIF